MKRLLIVDDNDRYARHIDEYFRAKGVSDVDRVYTANEGIVRVQEKGLDHYDIIVSDITMESQLAGLKLFSYLGKQKYPGNLIVASTGFDVKIGLWLSKWWLKKYGTSYLIPKRPMKESQIFIFHPCRLFTTGSEEYPF